MLNNNKYDNTCIHSLSPYLFVLVGSHSNKSGFIKCVCIKRCPSHTENVVGLHDVNTGLVLVHRVQNYLKLGIENKPCYINKCLQAAAKRIDSGQPARTAQADLSRDFLLL